ncbi:MAG: nitroreductase family protein [SAR324 cluster bacterium]|nr:nitroreductase family protein [SAR324 cluster bacterium]
MPNRLTMPIGEAMFSQRAIRRLKPDPIKEEDIRLMIEAAQKAPNGGNNQPGRFFVMNDPAIISEFGKLYHEAWWAKRKDEGFNSAEDFPKEHKTYFYAMKLADEIKDAPLIILACAIKAGVDNSVFPPVQNLLLAARALGIGSTLTTLHATVMERVHKLTGIPEDVKIYCCIPMGYPRGNFGPTKRLPSREITFFNQWGTAPPWS